MVTRTIGARGRVTIPVEIRRKMGLRPGEKVTFRDTGNGVVIEKADGAVHRSAGVLGAYAQGRPTVTIEEMKEAAAAGWATEPFHDNHQNHR